MKKWLLALCLLAQTGFSQIPGIDSLKRELVRLDNLPAGYVQDTLRYQTLKAISRLYADVNIDSSAHYTAMMVRLCQSPRLQEERVCAYQFLGYTHLVRGNDHESIRFHYKALALAKKLNQHARMARSYGALAHAYINLRQYAKATKLGQQGLAVLRQYPDPTVELSILNAFGSMYRKQKRFPDALAINQAMYKLAQQERIDWYEAQSLHTIGWDYMEMGDLKKPLGYYQKALTLARRLGSADLEESILLHTAGLYIRQKRWPKALAFCERAKQTAIRMKNTSIVAEAYEMQYTLFKQTGESAKALNAYESFIFLKDSLAQEKNQQRIETLQAQYDNVAKTNALLDEQTKNQRLAQMRDGLFLILATIGIIAGLLFWNNNRLQAKNRELEHQRTLLKIAQQQLADSNKTLEIRVGQRTDELVNANRDLVRKNEEIKEALFKGQAIERKRVALELHDNLSSLLSAVNMSIQTINPQNLSGSEQAVYQNVKQLIQNAYAEVRNISHNILPAGLEREGLAPTLTALVDRLNQNGSVHFRLTIFGLQERLPVEIEFNAYSIVLELITNALKHAQATTVSVSLLRTDCSIDILITDDGMGLGRTLPKQGIGLQNIQTRLDSLGGTFDIVLPTEKGARIAIKIPIETVSLNGNARVI